MSSPSWGQPPSSWGPPGALGRTAQPAGAWGAAPTSWPPQPGLPSYPQAPRPTPRNPLRRVLLGVITLALLALVGLVAVNLLAAPAQVAYQNDDYTVPPPDLNPPPLPEPKTEAEAVEFQTKNAFYNQTAPAPVRCNLSPIDVATASDGLLESHFTALFECILRVWEPPLTKAGFQIVRPTVTIYDESVTTKCGSGKNPQNAFYCGADQQVYWSRTLGPVLPPPSVDRWSGDVVLAHEFGHALQGRTGILISNFALRQDADAQDKLELSRRLEQQADCFSGIFMRSVSSSIGLRQDEVAGIEESYASFGDDTLTGKPDIVGDHGLARSRRYWGTTGLGTGDVGKCNTFVAPKSLVR